MTQPGETDNYTASAHAKAILDHAGAGVIDYVLVNSAPIVGEVENSKPVEIDEDKINAMGMGLVKADLVSEKEPGRHDPEKLCAAVMKMIYNLRPKFSDYDVLRN